MGDSGAAVWWFGEDGDIGEEEEVEEAEWNLLRGDDVVGHSPPWLKPYWYGTW